MAEAEGQESITSFEEFSQGGGQTSTPVPESQYNPYTPFGIPWDMASQERVYIDENSFRPTGPERPLFDQDEQGSLVPRPSQRDPYSGFNNPDEEGNYTSYDPALPGTGPSPFGDVVRSYYTASPANRALIQQMMVQAGFQLPVIPQNGWGDVTDPAFQQMWETVVTLAAQRRQPLMPMLRDLIAQNEDPQEIYDTVEEAEAAVEEERRQREAENRRRPDIYLSDPAALEDLIQETAMEKIGRELTTDERNVLQSIIGELQGAERSYGQAQGDAAVSPDGGNEITQVSVPAQAEQAIEEQFADEVEGFTAINVFEQIRQMIGNPYSQSGG